jgi:hypothetical protein
VVGAAAQAAVGVREVVDERDRVVVAAERRPGEGEPPRGTVEGLLDPVTPRARVARVVHLVEDHEGAPVLGAGAVQERVGGHACVGDGDAPVVRGGGPRGVAEVRVERDPDACGRSGPLVLEVLGGGDHGDRVDQPVGDQLGRHPQRERRLTGTGRRDREEVLRRGGEVAGERAALPGAQRSCGGSDLLVLRGRRGHTSP